MMETVNGTNATVLWTWTPIEWQWGEVLQLILAVAGLLGNFLVMLVLYRVRKKVCSTDALIAGLALADFLTSLFIIPHAQVKTLPDTPTAQFYCRVVHSSVLMWISICASIFTLTTISVERLIAVVRPFQFNSIFSLKRTILIIISIWFVALITNIVVMFVVYYKNGSCAFGYPSEWSHKLTGVVVFLVEYLFPVIIMVIAHVIVIRTLRRRRQGIAKGSQSSRRITGMLLVIVIIFVVCWSPDQIFYFALNLRLIDQAYLYSPLYRAFVVLAFANSCANPIVYAAMNPNFRQALKGLFGSVRIGGFQYIFADAETRASQSGDQRVTATQVELSSSIF